MAPKSDVRPPLLQDIQGFRIWAGDREISKGTAAEWKEYLKSVGYQAETINSKLTALNRFFSFLGWNHCRVKYLKIQRRVFRDAGWELSKTDYIRLLETARSLGKDRLALIMETICATGIRVSEVQYITAETIREGRAEVSLKGKIRTILFSGKAVPEAAEIREEKKNHFW